METVKDFTFLGSNHSTISSSVVQITADGDCSHEIKRCLLLGQKAMTNLDSVLKSKDITLVANKGLYSQNYGFSSSHVWMWELNHKEGWVPKNWCFWTAALEKILRVPWTARRSKQINPKGNQSWIFLEGWMLKLKLQSFGHLMWRTDSLEKTLMLRKIEGRKRKVRKSKSEEERQIPYDITYKWNLK